MVASFLLIYHADALCIGFDRARIPVHGSLAAYRL
jgi:hypothetical protein